MLGAYLAVKTLIVPETRIWVVAPTNDLTEKIWREILGWSFREFKPIVESRWIARGNWRITTKMGSMVECKSADDPKALLGEALDLLIVDEASRVKEIAWTESLRPTLADRKGKAVFISTPKGKNWFYQLYLRGLKGDGIYESWKLPSTSNPYIDKEEILAAKSDAPMTFKQEWLAEFIEDAGQVFRKIRENAVGRFEEPQEGARYVMGTDLAKAEDFTVSFVIRQDTGMVVAWDRFQGITWDMQVPRISALAKRYNNAKILIDSTGLGDPVYDTLRTAGSNIEGYKFTNPSKEALVRGLMIALENNEVTYPEIPELINELEAFEYTQGVTGIMKYNAPSGYHDDCVIALGLAVEAGRFGETGILEFYKELAGGAKPKSKDLQAVNMRELAKQIGQGKGEIIGI